MTLAEDFEKAANEVKTLTKEPTVDERLKLYALYKQANNGDNTTAQPWAVQVEARAKWDAYEKVKGTSKDDAMTQYIDLVKQLKATYA